MLEAQLTSLMPTAANIYLQPLEQPATRVRHTLVWLTAALSSPFK